MFGYVCSCMRYIKHLQESYNLFISFRQLLIYILKWKKKSEENEVEKNFYYSIAAHKLSKLKWQQTLF